MKTNRNKLNLGNLITALYEEAAKVTANKRLQTRLVYLTLMDMQNSRSTRQV